MNDDKASEAARAMQRKSARSRWGKLSAQERSARMTELVRKRWEKKKVQGDSPQQ